MVAAVAIMIASCSSSSDTTTTTSTTTTTTTTTVPTTTTTTAPTTTTTLPQEPPAFPEYRIAERIIAPETGDTVVLLLDPASYPASGLTDLALYDVIADAADRFPPILVAHVVDSPDAVEAVLLEQPDEDQELILANHYLARLEDGFRIVYLGPFEESGTAVLGS